MDNIKFRAYCKKRKEFVRIVDLGLFGTGEVKSVAFTYKDDPYERMDCDLPGDVELVQYAGLRDKNGAEIYEGDILSTDLDRPYLIVEFRNGAFMFQCHDNGKDYYDFMATTGENSNFTKYHEVIGNIYENPEPLGDSQ